MWPQHKSIKIPCFAPCIKGRHVRVQIINVVAIRRVLQGIPLIGGREFSVETAFGFGFVVDGVEADDALEEDV